MSLEIDPRVLQQLKKTLVRRKRTQYVSKIDKFILTYIEGNAEERRSTCCRLRDHIERVFPPPEGILLVPFHKPHTHAGLLCRVRKNCEVAEDYYLRLDEDMNSFCEQQGIRLMKSAKDCNIYS